MISEVTNHLWQSTFLGAAAAGLSLVLRRNRAAVRYWVWFCASVKFLVPFAGLMWMGTHWSWAPAAKTMAAPAVTLAVGQIVEPFSDSVVAIPSTPGWAVDWPGVALAVWACGVLGIGFLRLRGWRRVRSAVRASSRVEILASGLEVRSSDGWMEPGVVGLCRPVLLMPEGIGERLTAEQLRGVLAHELCHVRRRDNFFAAIHMVVEALFWFHPLVWWIGSRLVEERELACDEEVLRTVGEARVYADGILNVCRFYVESPLRCVAGVTGADLKKRIEAIMRNRAAEKLNFAKKVALAVAGMAAVVAPVVVGIMDAPALHAQAVGAIPKWEVASIRPCESSGAGGGRGGEPPVASLRLNCATVAMLIRSAYDTSADGRQTKMIPTLTITGGPSWINTERYTINAKAEGTPAQAMMRGPMMQALLEDRFQLKIRRETREVPVYELVAAKGGPKLKASREGTCPTPNPAGGSCPGSVWVARKGSNLVVDQQETLDGFSRMLSQRVGRPVIDKTGLKGLFDFHLEFMPDEPAVFPGDQGPTAPAAAADPGGASIFTAAQEQLGLRLEPAKGPGEFLVIDSIEKPSEN